MAEAAVFFVGLVSLIFTTGAALVIAAWFARRQRPTLAERLFRSHQSSIADTAEEWLRAHDWSASHGRRYHRG
jgi:hypothetical protein